MKTTQLLELAPKTFKADKNEIIDGSNSRANGTVVNLSKNKKSRKLTHMPNIKATEEPNFLTFNAKKAFNYLWLAFIKAPIFRHFDLESYIQIETNELSYAIDEVLS